MSKLRHVPSVVFTAALLLAGTASAQTWYDVREANQRERIQDGRADGELTRGEYRRLQDGQQRIERYENYAERDGRISGRERATLDNMLDRQGRQIYRETHDGQQAGERNGRGDNNGWGNGWRHDNGEGHGNWSNNGNGWNNGQGRSFNGFERREVRQENRIRDGVRDGSLTRGEAGRLQQGQNRVDSYQSRARADGVVTAGERDRINAMQNNQSRQIHDARTNTRTQGWRTQQAGAPAGSGRNRADR